MKYLLILAVGLFVNTSAFAASECWNLNKNDYQVRDFVYDINSNKHNVRLTTRVNTSAGTLWPKEFSVLLNSSNDAYELTTPVELDKDGVITTASLVVIQPKSIQENTTFYILKDFRVYYFETFYCKDIQESED